MEEQDGIALAHHLGRALQLTNILRDLDEDAAIGRLYLPREALREAGIATTDPATVLASPALGQVCARAGRDARASISREADKIMARSPRRVVRAPRIMARGLSRDPRRPDRARLVAAARPRSACRALRLLWIILRYAFI